MIYTTALCNAVVSPSLRPPHRGEFWLFRVTGPNKSEARVEQVAGGRRVLPAGRQVPLRSLRISMFAPDGAEGRGAKLEEPVVVLAWLLGVRSITEEDVRFFKERASPARRRQVIENALKDAQKKQKARKAAVAKHRRKEAARDAAATKAG